MSIVKITELDEKLGMKIVDADKQIDGYTVFLNHFNVPRSLFGVQEPLSWE